ncbi:hypothetical protein [Yinghuangia sp. YIM S10712]|uniref:hypothetical protein n=1 Tax=Yinghuangia sp. YIM S10712 TaxID=3436930 RepID=UPI003F52C619
MRALVGVAVACVLVLTACGEDDGSAKTSSPTSDTPSAATSPTSSAFVTQSPTASASPSPKTSASSASATASPTSAPASSAVPGPAPKSKEGAIQRYEQFLHAVGREDLDTICEVAGPAAEKAEDDGFGPCRSTFPITFRMIPDSQQQAMRTATVDPQRVVVQGPTKVVIPLSAVKSTSPLSEEAMGDSATVEYIGNNWYVTD